MTATSYNGWPVLASPPLDNSPIPGTAARFVPGILAGDVAEVLLFVGTYIHYKVEPAIPSGCGGYSYRPNTNNPSQWSCHASATAIDFNAVQHANGVRGTWSATERDAIHRLINIYLEGVVRWGDDFTSTVDGMHFEIIKPPADVARVAAKIRRDYGPRDGWPAALSPPQPQGSTMARFGIWKPLASNWASRPRMTSPDIISLHTMVGSLTGTDGMWRRTGYTASHSHFGVGGNGECWQWQDTAYRAAADYNGSHRIISVETADVGAPFAAWNLNDGSAVPAWTAAQCETLAQLIAAMCKAHNIPCVLIPDSKPGRRGIGYHRLGVPGYMVSGGEQWSTARGKACPGNRRIAQIPSIISLAQQILAGRPTVIQEDELPYTLDQIAEAVVNRIVIGNEIPLWLAIRNIHDRQVGYGARIEDTQARVTAIQDAVVKLASASGGLSPAEIETLVEKVLAENVVKVNVDVTPGPTP